MARSRSYVNIGGGGYPRANWYKRQLGTDYYSNQGGGEPVYSEEAQAVFAYAQDNAITDIETYEKTVYDEYLSKLSSSPSLWGKIIGLYRLDAPNKEFSKINLKNPGTYNLTESGTVTHTAKDKSKSASGSYYRTGINPSLTTVRGIGGRCSSGVNLATIGVETGSNVTQLLPTAGSTVRFGHQSAQQSQSIRSIETASSASVVVSNGDYIVNRESGDVVLYHDGKEFSRKTVAQGSAQNFEIFVLGENDDGTATFLHTNGAYYAVVFNASLTATEVFDFHQANEFFDSAIGLTQSPYIVGGTNKFMTTADECEVVLIAGQSNALGNAPISDADPTYEKQHWNAWFRNFNGRFELLFNGNDNGATGSARTTHGLEIKFARLNAKSKPVYYIKWALGSQLMTPLNIPNISPTGASNYQPLMRTLRGGLVELSRKFTTVTVKGLIFVQGEADAQLQSYADAYRTNFNAFLAQLKTDLSHPSLEVYAAKMNSGSVSINPYYATVNGHLDDMDGAGEITAVIGTETCTLADGQHYTSVGYDTLAELFYNAMYP